MENQEESQEYNQDFIDDCWTHGIWVTRYGEQIKIADMTNGHISRTIAMIERNFRKANIIIRDIEGNPTFMVLEIQDIYPIIVDLQNELAKRGMAID